MQGIKTNNAKVDNWKNKAKERRLENEKFKRRIRELEESRSNWKSKYMLVKSELSSIKKGNNIVPEKPSNKPKYHSYETRVIMFVLYLRQQGICSLRCCSKMLMLMGVYFHLELKFPCANTIRNWEAKHGMYRISQVANNTSDWMIIIDESIGIGKQKLLLILGINLSLYKFNQAPNFKDIQVLDASVSASWKWEKMHHRIEMLKQRGFNIKYGVSDGGASVVKSLKESGIQRIADCTHVFGNLMKNRYSKSEIFISYCRFCKQLKRRVLMGKETAIMPPTQRTKGKYLNIFPLIEWGERMLNLLGKRRNSLTESQIEKLSPLNEYRSLIKEMSQLCKAINKVFAILKNEGLSTASKVRCEQIINNLKVAEDVEQGMLDYLENYCISIDKHDNLICSSDIIESTFGKYKRNLNSTTKSQVNDSCLFIANYTENFSLEEVKLAMENVKIAHLEKWKAENTIVSLAKQKQAMFKNVG